MAVTKMEPGERELRRDEGASLVEFALVVPLLSLFLFGIVQFGIAYDMKQSINSAAREGARTAAIPTNDSSDIGTAVENGFQGLVDGTVATRIQVFDRQGTADPADDLQLYDSDVDSDEPCDGNVGHVVVVEATVQHTLTIPFFGAPVVDLTGRGEFRCERGA